MVTVRLSRFMLWPIAEVRAEMRVPERVAQQHYRRRAGLFLVSGEAAADQGRYAQHPGGSATAERVSDY
jgi:hypothetical protein